MAKLSDYVVRLTGDAGDLEIKLDGVIKKRREVAKATDKATRKEIDGVNLLVNKHNQVIEGLAKWRVEAGMYVDSAGKIRDKNNHLVEGLTTLQQKMGMYVDELGNVRKADGSFLDDLIKIEKKVDGVARAYDKNGNLVEGLERWRVELGQYYDDLGRVTDAQGRFFDGLSSAQIRGGLFADEEGNIRRIGDALGEIIGKTKELKEREKEAAEEARRIEEEADDIRRTFSEGLRGLGDTISQITGNIAELGDADTVGGVVAFGNALTMLTSGAQSVMDFSDAIKDFYEQSKDVGNALEKSFFSVKRYIEKAREAWDATEGAGSMFARIKAWLMTLPSAIMPVTAVMGGLAAAFVAWKVTAGSVKEIKASEEFKKISEEAKNAKEKLDSLGDALKVSAFKIEKDLSAVINDYKTTTEAYEKAKEAYEEALRSQSEAIRSSGGAYSGSSRAFNRIEQEYKNAETARGNAMAEYNKVATDFVKKATDAMTTEEERILNELAIGESVLKEWEAKKEGMSAKELEKYAEREKKIRDYMAKLNDDLAKAREGEVDAANDAADSERARAERLRNSGISSYLDQMDIPKITAESFRGVSEEWNKLVNEGLITQEQLNDALKRAKDVALDDLCNKLGVELPKSTDELMDEFETIAKALKDSVISEEQANQMRKAVRDKNTDDLISQFGLDAKKPEQDMFKALKEAFDSGKYDLSRKEEILGAAYEKRAEELASEQGIHLGESISDLMQAQKSYADKIQEWQKEFEAGHVTDKQLDDAKAALAKQYADEVARRTGVDLSVEATPKSKAESILADLDKKKGEWLEYLKSEGADMSVFDKAMAQLNQQAKDALDATLPVMDKVKSTQEKYASLMNDLKNAFEAGLYSQEEFTQRQKQINEAKAKELEAAQASARSALGLDRLQEEADRLTKGEASWRDAYEEQRKKIISAAAKGEIAEIEKNKALSNLKKIIDARTEQEKTDVKKKKAEEAKRVRDDVRSALGVDSIMESLKSPLQKFQETIASLNANKAFVSLEEYAAVWQNAMKEYQEASKSVNADSVIEEMKSGKAKTTAGTAIQAGSSEMYKALISRQAPTAYESTMQSTTKRIQATQEEGNQIAQENNYYLQQMIAIMEQQNNGGVAVFG